MPKSCPIICNSESVRALLDNRKTQSRRTRGLDQLNDPASKSLWHLLRTEGDIWTFTHPSLDFGHAVIKCPFGVRGDTLWVRETWATLSYFDDIGTLPSKLPTYAEIIFKATDEEHMLRGKWRSPLHLPKRFSRITLEIKDVRVERVQDITSSEALREGILSLGRAKMLQNFPEYAQKYSEWRLEEESQRKHRPFEAPIKPPLAPSPRARFGKWWNSINAKKGFGWEMNPFVFVLEFEVT